MAENKEMQLTIPYIVHEAAQARSERTIKRLTIGIIVVSILSITIAFLTGYFIDKGWRDYFLSFVWKREGKHGGGIFGEKSTGCLPYGGS